MPGTLNSLRRRLFSALHADVAVESVPRNTPGIKENEEIVDSLQQPETLRVVSIEFRSKLCS